MGDTKSRVLLCTVAQQEAYKSLQRYLIDCADRYGISLLEMSMLVELAAEDIRELARRALGPSPSLHVAADGMVWAGE